MNTLSKVIIESKIDYKVFCEYGIGTRKYYNWFDKIMEIDDIDEFIRAKIEAFSVQDRC